VDKYKEVHAKVWPEVLKQIKDSNIEDCEWFPESSF
jgi:L-rhamnose mutarotase